MLWVVKGLGLGGTERLTVSCVPRFDTDRFDVEVAYTLPSMNDLAPPLETAGVTVHCVGTRSPFGWIPALVRLAVRGGYEIVHTHSPLPAVALRAVAGRTRPVLVHTEHNEWSSYRPPTRVANALTYNANRSVLAVSDGVRRSIRRPTLVTSYPPAATLHHGIDPATAVRGDLARATARDALDLPPDAPVIGTVGSLTPKKDQATLLDAAALVAGDRPDLRVVVVGAGPEEAKLRHRAGVLGLSGRLVFAGARDDVQRILPAFDVFVLSSLHEGLSIALLEAMAAAVPPVATAVGGVTEVIEDSLSGFLVPVGASRDIADRISRLLDDRGLRVSMSAAAERRSHRFGVDRAVRYMERWYEQVAA